MALTAPRLLLAAVVCLGLVSGCGQTTLVRGSSPDPQQVQQVTPPELGACRVLTPEDVARPSNDTETVPCSQFHTAQTYAVGALPARFDDAAWDDEDLSEFAYQRCEKLFARFLGATQSEAMRTILSWAWFRPSKEAWSAGARWYRCDVVGGGADDQQYVALPETAKGLLLGQPADKWMACARGPQLSEATRVRCSKPHTWRAVTTIKLGGPEDEYPGDRVVKTRTRNYCSRSVAAWLGYPIDYEFGYTWFGKAQWQAGNRRSVCWAKEEST